MGKKSKVTQLRKQEHTKKYEHFPERYEVFFNLAIYDASCIIAQGIKQRRRHFQGVCSKCFG